MTQGEGIRARSKVMMACPGCEYYHDQTVGVHLIMWNGKIIGASANTPGAAWHDAVVKMNKSPEK